MSSEAEAASPPAVEVRGVTVEFPGVRALDNASISIASGEVRALMGRNGAGKSTMVRVLSGIQQPTDGEVAVAGVTMKLDTPTTAMNAGIATVHQELTIIPGLSIAENVTLGNWPTRAGGQIDRRKQREVANEALAMLGEKMDVAAPAGSLSLARQQLVEIARSVIHRPKVLILDEPTSSLPAHEVEKLLDLVRRLSTQGMSVIYVSHRMDEIARVAHSVTVVRDGRVIDTLPIAQAPVRKVAELMVGSDTDFGESRPTDGPGPDAPVALRVVDITDSNLLKGISFDVKAGEVLGIAGLLGSGRTELLRGIAGAGDRVTGKVEVFGKRARRRTTSEMIKSGVTLVPEDRKAEGLVLGLSVGENLWMSSHEKIAPTGVISRKAASEMAEASKRSMDIKVHDFKVEAGTLSGGNQQKVVLGRCVSAGARVLLLDEPTRGVDVHAKAQIYDLIRQLSHEGNAVVVVSSEYEELLLVCHRILVMTNGAITDEFDTSAIEMSDLMARVMRTEPTA
ncbi:sugar ABC transporter ATP-binding protein [Microbacterium sp. CPCC 204701]|uniref:sugar ABC transporter ATP-binding protein n=1 Tax=Microbacterium sp. CPCC 204701 TaxID=2493084 RepID=UPI000FD6E76D|nr:sugar ABC transporter ATP-binding protein [Microbacterium sp. CPCC 204701]